MAGNREIYKEAIRLYVETSGDAELKALVNSFGDLGEVADFQATMARKALEQLGQAAENIGKVKAFDQLKRDLIETEQKLGEAQAGAQALFREFNTGDTSSAKVAALQRQAKQAVNELSASADSQRLALQGLRRELSSSGVDTRQLGTAQGTLKAQMAEARTALANAGQSIKQYRAESARAAAQVPANNREIAQSYTLIERGVGRLRGLIAGAGAYLGFREAAQGIQNLAEVASQAENARRALQNLYGSQAEGNRAHETLRTLSKENGIAFDVLVESAKKLKAFGLDPLNGSLQALIDQNAAVGGSNEDLSGKVLALGQAWAKQKLQGEEILQLVERGVPVWDLLQKATGKNVQELQKLSEQGKLGRETIKALYEEIGKANSGAANASLSGLSGLMAQMSARWVDFKQRIVDAGLGDYFKQQMQSLLQSTGGMDGLAKRVSASIIATIESVRAFAAQLAPVGKVLADVTLWLGRNANAIVALGKAYLGMQLLGVVTTMTRMVGVLQQQQLAARETGVAMAGATGAARGLGLALRAIPGAVLITVALVGLQGARAAVQGLAEDLAKNSEASKHAGEVERQTRNDIYATAIARRQLAADNSRYKDTLLKAADATAKMSAAERDGYAQSLAGLRQYQQGQLGYLLRLQELGMATQQQTSELGLLRDAMRSARTAQDDLSRAIKQGGTDAQTEAQQFAAAAKTKFDGLVQAGKRAADAVQGAFDGLDLTKAGGAESAALALDVITKKGGDAAKAINAELRAALEKVSADDFPKLAGAARFAMDTGVAGAKALADSVAAVNLSKLGVDLGAIRTGFTEAGRAAVDGFERAVNQIDDLGLTAAQKAQAIALAFDNAFKQASTKAELAALKKSLQDALSSGDIGFKEFQVRIVETDAKLAALLGSVKKIPPAVDDAANNAANSLGKLGDAATEAAGETKKAGDETEKAGDNMRVGGKEGQQFAISLYEVSQKANDAYFAITRMQSGIGDSDGRYVRGMNEMTARITNQGKAIEDKVKALQAANAEFDELAGRRKELAQQYDLLGAGEIEKLVQAEQQLEANRKRAAEQRQRQNEADARAAEQAAQTQRTAATDVANTVKAITPPVVTAIVPPASSRVPLEVVLKVDATGAAAASALTLSQPQIQQISRALLPMLISELERRRMASR